MPFLLCHTGAQIRQLVDFILGENRTIRKYLPKGLKKHNYPKLRKRIDEIGIFSNIEDNNLIEVSSTVESVEAIPQRGKPENPLTEKEWQDIEALRNKIDEQERLIDDFKKTLKDKDELIVESESKLRGQAEKIEMLSVQVKDYTDNLRESQEFKKATRQIEIAYEDQINHWRAECKKANEKYHDINRIPKIIEFSPNRLGCLDVIFENRDGVLYLQHDGLRVIKVTAAKPIEQGGEIVG